MPERTVTTKFFHFSQNNSGGTFDFDKDRGITHYVIVEATDAKHANNRAEDIGLYFDGAGDCPCCGNRWGEVDDTDGYEQPLVYGMNVENIPKKDLFRWMDAGFEIAVHYLDGTIQWFE